MQRPSTALLVILLLSSGPHSVDAQLAKGPRAGSVPGGVVVTTDTFSLAPMKIDPAESWQEEYDGGREIPSHISPSVPPSITTRQLSRYIQTGDAAPMTRSTVTLLDSFPGMPDVGESGLPPEPVLAAGPQHIVVCVNRRFRIWEKGGTVLKTISAASWFATVLGPGSWAVFDPKIQYDHFANRWIMVWLADDRPTRSKGYQLISVSDDDNPLGTWYNWAIPSNMVGDSLVTNLSDFPGFGFDDSAFYISTDQTRSATPPPYAYVYHKFRVYAKAQFYANTPGPITWTDFWDLRDPENLSARIFSAKPAIIFGTPGVAFFLNKSPYATLTVPGTFFTLWKITDVLTNPTIGAANIPVGSFLQSPETFGQQGGSNVSTFSWSDLSSEPVYRDSSLWAAHDVASGTGNQYSSLHYIRVNPFTNALLEDVVFGQEGCWYILPTLMVDQSRNLVLTYSRSSLTEYIGAYLAGRLDTDPPGQLSEVVLKSGETAFQRVPGMRWGDYNGIALDPTDGSVVWACTEYAASPSGTWGTQVGKAKVVEMATAASAEVGLPGTYQLDQNYPNPFNPSTSIEFDLPTTSEVRLSVYDVLGREVAILVNERKAPGSYGVKFDASNLSSGIYLYTLATGSYRQTRKMVVAK